MLSRTHAALGALALATILPAAPVDYVRDVKPILTQHCYRCHGASQQKSDMRADTAAFLRTGGASGPSLVAGKSGDSLLVQTILGTHDEISRMPYKKPALTDAQVATIRTWIDEGAVAPTAEEPEKNIHWAFIPPARPALPKIEQQKSKIVNPLDAFVLAQLAKEKIAPSPEADRVTLLRRVSLDLTGLPPTPAEAAAFLADQSPDAYARVVDRLLASPHHGERWARPWLDVARYADSNGYSIDAPRQIWKYRDWVVAALNRDLPYDQFVIEQIGGDLLPNATIDQKVATGFNRNTQINQEGGIDPEQFRIEAVMDRVNTFGTAFLGLTVGCAQCHDHKFDPVSQREYYQLYSIFNNTVEDGHGKNTPGGTLAFRGEKGASGNSEAEIAEATLAVTNHINTHGSKAVAWLAGVTDDVRAKLRPNSLRAAVEIPWEKQDFRQRRAVYAYANPNDAEFKGANERLTALERNEAKLVTTLVMQELPKPRSSVIFIKGDFTRPGDPVTPGTPAILPPGTVEKPNRLDLARWLFVADHPLTARVMVNRIWQQYFGRGLVETENDFGTQGLPPSHPDLLDYLATEFAAQKWSMKAMHRLIVTSETYRRSSLARPDLHVVDPVNKFLAHQSRLRLDAEIVRDVSLAASGLLAPTLGGPPVYPPQPEGVMNLGQVRRPWLASTDAHLRLTAAIQQGFERPSACFQTHANQAVKQR
jgi:mono/diheme cytochrome c family protein